jgi:signal transduction histidine kinase/CheY-like chemotaxis protein
MFVLAFDVCAFALRVALKALERRQQLMLLAAAALSPAGGVDGGNDGSSDVPFPAAASPPSASQIAREMGLQLANMASLHAALWLLNARSRRAAARRERAAAAEAAAEAAAASASKPRSLGGATTTTSASSSSSALATLSQQQQANAAAATTTTTRSSTSAAAAAGAAAAQEELLLAAAMGAALCALLASLGAANASDYVLLCLFLVCISTFLKLRWWVGTAVLALPALAAQLLHSPVPLAAAARSALAPWFAGLAAGAEAAATTAGTCAAATAGSCPAPSPSLLPPDAAVHVLVAWAVGGLMAFLGDSYRRGTFLASRRAAASHAAELRAAASRAQAERELGAAHLRLEWMSLMCHEVRTPLNGCLASAEMLLETPLGPEQRELARTIRVSGAILLTTVSSFLDYFKMEAGRSLDVVRCGTDLRALARDVHVIVDAMIGRDSLVRLRPPEIGAGVPGGGGGNGQGCGGVLCDGDRIRGILLNLYSNAAKFTRKGTIQLRIRRVEPGFVPAPPPGHHAITLSPSAKKGGGGGSGAGGALTTAANGGEAAGEGGGKKAVASSPSSSRASSDAGDAPPGVSAEVVLAAGGGVDTAHEEHQEDEEVVGGGHRMSRSVSDGSLASLAGGPSSSSSSALAALAAGASPTTAAQASALPGETVWLLFEVEDTGVGMTREGLACLFREYSQGDARDAARPRPRGGTGLGLAICSRQVAVLGGSIGAVSAPGVGSTFWFRVPVVAAAAAAAAPAGAAADVGSEAAAAGAPAAAATALPVPAPPPALAVPVAAAGAACAPPPPPAAVAADGAAPSPGAGGGGGLRLSPPAAPQRAGPDGHHTFVIFGGQGDDDEEDQEEEEEAAPAAAAPVPAASTGPPTPPLASPAPRGLATSPAQAPSPAAPPQTPTTNNTSQSQLLAGRRVLLAEDNLINQTVARKMLASLGCSAAVAADGNEAAAAVEAARLRGEPFDLVLMDVLMPVCGGLEATRRIRAAEEEAGTSSSKGGPAIVAMTANASDRDRRACRDAGMDAYLCKPVLRGQLAETVGLVLGLRDAGRLLRQRRGRR